MLLRRNKKKKKIEKTLAEVARGTKTLSVGDYQMSKEDLNSPGMSVVSRRTLLQEKESDEHGECMFNAVLLQIQTGGKVTPEMMKWL
jgi:hypothetical protein